MGVRHCATRQQRSAGVLLVLGLVMGGCAAGSSVPSEQRYAAAVEAMRGSPAQRQKAAANCVASLDRQPATNRQNLASLANVPLDRASGTICNRVVEAMVDGRMGYSELATMGRGELTPELVKVIQGR